MFQGLLALLGRSLRIDARSWQVHLARVGLMVAIYISLSYALATGDRFGAPGLRFFRSIVWLNTAFMTLLGIGFFSTAISEEKEEDTLGLMQMAGINPLGIILGKMGGRLFQALLLIAVQYPFTLLAVTMGGVTSTQAQAAFVGLGAYMMMLAGVGLLCSTIASSSRIASALMTLGLIVYGAVPYSAYEFHRVVVTNGLLSPTSTFAKVLEATGNTCLLFEIPEIMVTGFGESPWTVQVISNIIGGLICFVTAWAVFPYFTRNPSTERISRGLLTFKKKGIRWLNPGRPRTNPFLWKDFNFIGGGWGMLLIRGAFYLSLFVVVLLLGEFWWGNRTAQYPFQQSIGMYQFIMLFVVPLELSVLSTRVLHDEVRGQTLATLVMLPESLPAMIYSKMTGALLTAIPGLSIMGLVTVGTPAGRYQAGEFLDHPAGWFFLTYVLLAPHTATVLAMYMRWGCIPLAIGVSVGLVAGWISIFEACRIGPHDNAVNVATVFGVGLWIACHVWTLMRLPAVAART